MKRPIVRILLLGSVAIIGGAAFIAWELSRPLPIDAEQTVRIARGTSIAGAVDSVDRSIGLPSPTLTRLVARVAARFTQRQLHPGWYAFQPGTTSWDVVAALLSGRHRPTRMVTIPEGLTYREIASLLRRKAEIDSAAFVVWCENDSIVKRYTDDAPSMEGYLMPDTYEVLWRDDAAAIGDRLAAAAQRAWRSLATDRPRREVLTLASIVQAETGANDEMRTIAGVYQNRLRIGMRLEADPTVQYGIGERRRVFYRDLDDRHAYNTYVVRGLPQGPIGNPGAAAMRAAIDPERHSYLYFVARGDSSGRHRFAATGEEHLRNVRLYRAARR